MVDDGSSMPGWAAFDKDEERPPRRKLSPTTVVVVAGALAAAVVVGGVLLPGAAPARTASAQASPGPTALPTASGTPAPTLSKAPPDPAASPVTPAAPAAPTTPGAAPTDGSAPTPDGTAPAPAAPAAPAPPAPPAAQVMGPPDAYVTTTVPATSRDAVDAGSRPVTYAAANLFDGRTSTAWRADGDLEGQVLTFTFDRPRQLSKVGLVNGYAKVDPVSRADRYAQTRRITRVTWTVDGQEVVQDLRPDDRDEQVVRFPPVVVRSVSLRLDAVTAPGDPRFDETAISEVVLADD